MGGKAVVLSGTIFGGLGEGAYFISMRHYRKEVKKKLGFKAYPGTLNLKISRNKISLLKRISSIRIAGFKENNKVFGGADCYKAKIKGINGSIIVPDLTKHQKNIIELIAPVQLRSELSLKDGDKIKIELMQ